MEWYHFVVEAKTESKGGKICLLSLDKTEEDARRFADALSTKKRFLLEGKIILASQVHRVSVFRTSKPTVELVLPNGRSIADYKNSECKPVGCCKHRYIATCFKRGRVKEASDCTVDFLSSRTS